MSVGFSQPDRGALSRSLLSLIGLALLLELGRSLWGAAFSWLGLAERLAFVSLVLALSRWSQLTGGAFEGLYLPLSLSVGVLLLGGALSLIWPTVGVGSWLLLGGWYGLLVQLDRLMSIGLTKLPALLLRLYFTVLAGVVPVALAQMESRFAEEEFFVAVQVMALALFWLMLRILSQSNTIEPGAGRSQHRYESIRIGVVVVLLLGTVAGVFGFIRAYQQSFYDEDVTLYPGISSAEPFLCGTTEKISSDVDGREVFNQLLGLIAANPQKGAPELGMLALGTDGLDWAYAFRREILDEAEAGRFARPAGSVKYQQYSAALRLYYYLEVQQAFPDLFSPAETVVLDDWFRRINERALTIEWVDLMYALAFSKWPDGPYENQETGAALLALMELAELDASSLHNRNQAYLQDNVGGWMQRFRNTDDTYAYQPQWITNAYFQSLYTKVLPRENLEHSFEWLALQLLPDGTSPTYNHPGTPRPAGALYLGGLLLDDPHLIWLASQSLNALDKEDQFPTVQPGIERPAALKGTPPLEGSCLIYGDSGLPNQTGPLAPDKVVFREGWSADDAYALLNLRFSGWHRYKATGVIPIVYWRGALAIEVLEAQNLSWLPEGRSLFRDKRIPRENLNGLLVERTGLSAVVHSLTGAGGRWAQDPPHYADVVHFETTQALDWTTIRVNGWRGWTHRRSVFLVHNGGPIVVVDEADGPAHRLGAVVWHLADASTTTDQLQIRDGDDPVRVNIIALDDAQPQVNWRPPRSGVSQVTISGHGSLHVATVFLLGDWAAADTDITYDRQSRLLGISGKDQTVSVQLPD